MSKVVDITLKEDKNGNPMKETSFDTGQKVWINSKYDADFDKVVEDAEFELVKEGSFWKIKTDKPRGRGGSTESSVKRAQDTKREDIKTAQTNKEESIKISSTFRDATLIAIAAQKEGGDFRQNWKIWRAWLWEQYDKPLDPKWITENTEPF